jgi:hypothetical protein
MDCYVSPKDALGRYSMYRQFDENRKRTDERNGGKE